MELTLIQQIFLIVFLSGLTTICILRYAPSLFAIKKLSPKIIEDLTRIQKMKSAKEMAEFINDSQYLDKCNLSWVLNLIRIKTLNGETKLIVHYSEFSTDVLRHVINDLSALGYCVHKHDGPKNLEIYW